MVIGKRVVLHGDADNADLLQDESDPFQVHDLFGYNSLRHIDCYHPYKILLSRPELHATPVPQLPHRQRRPHDDGPHKP